MLIPFEAFKGVDPANPKEICTCAAGALAAAGLEVDAVAGMCVGMSGVDRPADVDVVREYLQAWLPVGVGLMHA